MLAISMTNRDSLCSSLGDSTSAQNQFEKMRKNGESRYLRTYKALHLRGNETLESKIIRLIIAHFHINACEAKIQESRNISNISDKSNALREHAIALARMGKIDEAFALAKEIPSQYVSWSANKDILEHLIRVGDVDSGIKIVASQPDPYRKNQAFLHISSCLITSGRIDNIQRLVRTPDIYEKTFFEICKLLAENEYFDAAILVSQLIDDNFLKGQALCYICMGLAKNRYFDTAINFARLIVGTVSQSTAYLAISQALTANKDFDRSIRIARSNPDVFMKYRAFIDIIGGLARNGDFDRAQELASSTSFLQNLFNKRQIMHYKNWAYLEICKAYINAGIFHKATELALLIPNRCGAIALLHLAKRYLELEDIEKWASTLVRAIELPILPSHEHRLVDKSVQLIFAGKIDEAMTALEVCFNPQLTEPKESPSDMRYSRSQLRRVFRSQIVLQEANLF